MLLDPPVIMDWAIQIACGMNYLHEVALCCFDVVFLSFLMGFFLSFCRRPQSPWFTGAVFMTNNCI